MFARSPAGTINTGISVNGGSLGKTLVAIASAQDDAGNNTLSSIYMIRCGYNGNNWQATKIAEDNHLRNTSASVTYNIDSEGKLTATISSGGMYLLILSNKAF